MNGLKSIVNSVIGIFRLITSLVKKDDDDDDPTSTAGIRG